MSKVRFLIFAIMPFVFLSLSFCQKVEVPEGGKDVQKGEVRQLVLETESKIHLQEAKKRTGQLTEEEQKSFEGCLEPRVLTREDALKYLRILVKGDSETIRWYREYEKDPNRMMIADRRSLYQMDICSTVLILFREKNKESYSLILQVIEQKAEYPRARSCAIRAVGMYGELKDGKWHGDKRSIPVLKKIVNDKDPEVRLQAAGILLSLGKGDIALPVLDELAKAGVKESTAALKKLFTPEEKEINGIKRIVLSNTKIWDERGKDILIKALNYSGDEVKAIAAVSLANMEIEKESVEDTAIKILEQLKRKRMKDYKKVEDWQSDRNAGFFAIAALMKIKSTAGIDVLEKIIENSDDTLLQKRAKSALEKIQQK